MAPGLKTWHHSSKQKTIEVQVLYAGHSGDIINTLQAI